MDNPYEPPKAPVDVGLGPVPQGPQRPTAATVFGVLNIIFGVLGLLCTPISLAQTLMAGGMQPVPNANANPALQAMQEAMADPTYRTIMIVMGVVGMIVAGVLLAAGIALLNNKPWGRTFSIGYGYYAIVASLLGLVINYVYLLQPMMKAAEGVQGPEKAGLIGGAIGGTLGGCLGLIYPILLLIFMNNKAIVDFYRPANPADVF